jgi:hypothetical protein
MLRSTETVRLIMFFDEWILFHSPLGDWYYYAYWSELPKNLLIVHSIE